MRAEFIREQEGVVARGRPSDGNAFIESNFPSVIANTTMSPSDTQVLGNFIYGNPLVRDNHPDWAKNPERYEYVKKITPNMWRKTRCLTATIYSGTATYASGPIEVPNRRGTVYIVHYEPFGRTIYEDIKPKEKDIAYYVRGDNVFEIYDSRYSPLLFDHIAEEIQSPMARVGQSLPGELLAWILNEGDIPIAGSPIPPVMVEASTSPFATPRQASGSANDAPCAAVFHEAQEVSPLRVPLPKARWPTTPAKRASSAGAPDVRKLITRGHLDYQVVKVHDSAHWNQACQCGCGQRIKEGDTIVKVIVHQRPATAYREDCWITHMCAHELQFAYLSEFATAARTARNIQPGA